MLGRSDGYVGEANEAIAALKIVAATLAALLILATLGWEIAHHFAMPVQDDVYDRLRYYRARQSGVWDMLKYLISAHNEHRIATTRLFALLDENVFSGREYTQVIATNTLQLVLALAVYLFVFRADLGRSWSLSQRALVLASLGLLFINPNLLYTLIVPFQLQHAIMAALTIAAAILVSAASDRPISEREETRLIAALIGLALIGTFTLGNAPAILISACASAIVLRRRRRFILILAALAIVHTGLVLATTTSVGETTNDVVKIFKFSLIYWGSPFLRFEPWPANYATWGVSAPLAAIFGAAVLFGALIFALLRWLIPGLGGRAAIFGLTVATIVIITGIAAAHSRAQFGILEASNKKYASFAALGWLALLAIVAGLAHERFRARQWPVTAVFVVFLAVMGPLSALGYCRETRIWQTMIDRNWENSLAVLFHVNDADGLREIYVDPAMLAEYVGDIEPRNRSIFALFPFRWGDEASSVLARRAQAGCRSEVQTLDAIDHANLNNVFDAPGTPMTISGWTWMNDDHAPPETIIAVDSKDRIVGAARVTRTGARAEDWLGQKMGGNVGWFGYARLTEPQPVRFFALSADGKRYCALGEVGHVNEQ